MATKLPNQTLISAQHAYRCQPCHTLWEALLPGSFEAADVLFALPPAGTFEIYCQTSNHYQAGMREQYSVSNCNRRALSPALPYRAVRTYYVAAEEVEWDYAPDRGWERERHNHSAERYGLSWGSPGPSWSTVKSVECLGHVWHGAMLRRVPSAAGLLT